MEKAKANEEKMDNVGDQMAGDAGTVTENNIDVFHNQTSKNLQKLDSKSKKKVKPSKKNISYLEGNLGWAKDRAFRELVKNDNDLNVVLRKYTGLCK